MMSFVAQYDGGYCASCKRLIWRGDLVEKVGPKSYEHVDCEDLAGDRLDDLRPDDAPPLR